MSNNTKNGNTDNNLGRVLAEYRYILIGTLVFVLVLILSLFLSLNGRNRLQSFNLAGTDQQQVNPYFQTLTFEFSRNLQPGLGANLASYIKFQPEIAGNFRQLGNKVIFVPNQVLLYDQAYQIDINPNLLDTYGKQLQSSYQLSFSTKPQRLLWQQQGQTGSELSNLLLGDLKGSKELILENKNLKEFAVSYQGDKLAYIIQDVDTPESNASKLYRYDFKLKRHLLIELPNKLNIYSLQFDRLGNLIFLGNTPNEQLVGVPATERSETITKAYQYDFKQTKLLELANLSGHYADLVGLASAPKGNTVLLQKFSGDYVLAALDSSEASPLGQFYGFGGFSYSSEYFSGSAINFDEVDFFPGVKVLNDQGVVYSSASSSYIKDPDLAKNSSKIVYAIRQRALPLAEGVFALQIEDFLRPEVLKTISADNASLELPRLNGDEQYLGYEKLALENLEDISRPVRKYVNAGRPVDASLEVLKLFSPNNETIALGTGYNLTWIP